MPRLLPIVLFTACCALAPLGALTQAADARTMQQGLSSAGRPTDADLDKLLAPIALYPDALVVQILQCAQSPFQVKAVDAWLTQNPTLKGSDAQDAASKQGFDASFVAIVLFPDVVRMLASQPDWTTSIGQAFIADKDAVMTSVQRLRAQAQSMGNLQSNQQQSVQTVGTQSGQQVIVIQPANPQVVYVPQYNPQVVYTQPAPAASSAATTGDVAAAGVIGFAAGVIVGAAADNDDHHYYYASGGWGYPAPVCYPGGYNNYYQHQQNMANDYYNHRENMANDYYDHRENMAGQAGQNQQQRQDWSTANQQQRQSATAANQSSRQQAAASAQQTSVQNQQSIQSGRVEAAQSMNTGQTPRPPASGSGQAYSASRGTFDSGSARPRQGGGFSGYQSGASERASSDRGYQSMSRSQGGGGASFGGSRGGGGGGGGSAGGRGGRR